MSDIANDFSLLRIPRQADLLTPMEELQRFDMVRSSFDRDTLFIKFILETNPELVRYADTIETGINSLKNTAVRRSSKINENNENGFQLLSFGLEEKEMPN